MRASHSAPFSRAPTAVPPDAPRRRRALARAPSFHSHRAISRAYRRHSRWPPPAALAHASDLHGAPFSCAYLRHSRCPFAAALVVVHAFQGAPFFLARTRGTRGGRPRRLPRTSPRPTARRSRARAYRRTSRWPFAAAAAHVAHVVPSTISPVLGSKRRVGFSNGAPFATASLSASRRPSRASAAHSAGSSEAPGAGAGGSSSRSPCEETRRGRTRARVRRRGGEGGSAARSTCSCFLLATVRQK